MLAALAAVAALTVAELDQRCADAGRLSLQHQLRNHQAMAELAAALPAAERPRSILYLAAGSHVAPLALCEALPAGEPCRLVLADVDPGVRDGITTFLTAAAGAGAIPLERPVDGDEVAPGRWRWQLDWAGHPLTLELRVPPGSSPSSPLISPADLAGVDLAISHDWSGDPLGNLQLIRELLLAARAAGVDRPPRLMIEDLEAHPFPVDLELLGPLARSSQPYGHRSSDAGLGHGEVELGAPLFGGAVVLGFADPWWRTVDEATLDAVLDVLLLARFDTTRQNVLEGGPDPLLAPHLLDWWTGYGARSVSGRDLRADPGFRAPTLRAALAALDRLTPPSRERLACLLATWRSLLEARAAGLDFRTVLPSAEHARRPTPGAFPSPAMEQLNRVAERHARDVRADEEAAAAAARAALAAVGAEPLAAAEAACPVARGDWLARYRALTAWLDRRR